MAVLVGWAQPAWAQIPPRIPQPVTTIQSTVQPGLAQAVTSTPFAAPCDTNAGGTAGTLRNCTGLSTDLTYQGNNQRLEFFEAAGRRYQRVFPPGEEVVFRRSTNSTLQNREILFFEYPGAAQLTVVNGQPITLVPSPAAPGETIEDILLAEFANRGIDNVFNNGAAGQQDTRTNVQRIDYIVPGGVTTPVANRDLRGFVVFERGGNDNFRIAAITGLAGGVPSAYGPLIQAGPGNPGVWGGTGTPGPENNIGVRIRTVVSRRDLTADPAGAFRPSHIVDTQNVRGIFFSINSLVPDTQDTIFGYSLFANDVPGPNLVAFDSFPTNTSGANDTGGLDLVAGGFGLFEVQPGAFSLVKRITNLLGAAAGPNFNQVEGAGPNITLLQNEGLGQGLTSFVDPPVTTGNGLEYTIYLTNTGVGDITGVVVCDQIPIGSTFNPDGFEPGRGIRAIAPSAPAGSPVTYTNAADGDPGRFIPPGSPLPTLCGQDQGNGAVVVDVGTVRANQVGFVSFRTTIN